MLRDRLVCGIGNSQMQKRLLAEPDLAFDKAVKLALAQESVEQNAAQLQKNPIDDHSSSSQAQRKELQTNGQ